MVNHLLIHLCIRRIKLFINVTGTMKNPIQGGLALLTITGLIILSYNIYLRETTPPSLAYSDFLTELAEGCITHVELQDSLIVSTQASGKRYSTYRLDDDNLLHHLQTSGVHVDVLPPVDRQADLIVKILLFGVIAYALRLLLQRRSGGMSKDGFSQKAFFSPVKSQLVTLSDVAGIGEAKQEIQEIVEFLKKPEKYSKLGAKIPKGVLLQGPPGTGKTLLAKAIAGEASVAFFSLGGSDFVEMFVGVGASRVRELFAEAKKMAPCIIFIDEIDAIGGKRTGNASSGAGDEREQTLNALLVEMDGFSSEKAVIVLAATNRPEVLDHALMRPGRFDRQVNVSLPDMKGRNSILEVHASSISISPSVDLSVLARSIPGFSGAEIFNLVNEAALMAGRHNKDQVEMSDFEEAKDKIIMGLERKSLIQSEQERRVTAYHEAGHAIVSLLAEETDPLHKITIIPRGLAMGLTQQIPLDDRHTYSVKYLISRIKVLMGGRAAESLVFNRFTTGASNDIAVATDIASRLVCEWGMNDVIGPVALQREDGRASHAHGVSAFSEATAELIDKEIKSVLTTCYEGAFDILQTHNKFLHKFAEILLLNETLDGDEADIVFRTYLREQDIERRLSGQYAQKYSLTTLN